MAAPFRSAGTTGCRPPAWADGIPRVVGRQEQAAGVGGLPAPGL